MTGAEQEQWLLDGLAASRARWNVLAQQTIFAEVDFDDPASPTVGVEFVGTSISSDFPAVFIAPVQAALVDNPHIKFFDGLSRGYVRCHLTPERWRTDFRAVATVDAPEAPVVTLRSFVVENGVPGVQPA
jgi:alkaline phosphatase D